MSTQKANLSSISGTTESVSFSRIINDLHWKAKSEGDWDVTDTNDPLKRKMVNPFLYNNQQKLIKICQRLVTISGFDFPQNQGDSIVGVIADLLDFCAAHGINVEQGLLRLISEHDQD